MPVYIDQHPNKYFQISAVLNNALDQYQQQQAQQDQDARARAYLAAQQIARLSPDQVPSAIASLPDDVKGYFLDPSRIATHQPTLDEINAQKKGTVYGGVLDSALAAQKAGTPFTPDPILTGLADTDLAGKAPWMGQANTRYTYANASQLPANAVKAEDIATKIAPTGQEQWTNTNITLPKNNAEITHLGAQTTQANAAAAASTAQAREANAKASGQERQNRFWDSMTGGVQSGAADASGASQIAKDIAARKYDPMLLRNLVSKDPATAEMLERQVQTIDPTFSMADYPKQVAALKEYSQAGQTGKSITAVNTAIRHVNTFLDDLSKMNNTRSYTYNAVANSMAAGFGDEGIQQHSAQVQKDASAVANELNKAFRGSSQLSEKDTQDWKKGMDQNATPATGKGAASAAIHLLAGRLNEVRESYKRDTGLDAPDFLQSVRPILEKFKKLGVEGVDDLMSGGSAAPSGGSVIRTPDGLSWRQNADGSMTQVQ